MKRTCEYKLQAVAQAKMTSNHAAARALGLEESTVRHWRRNEEKLKEQMRQVGIGISKKNVQLLKPYL